MKKAVVSVKKPKRYPLAEQLLSELKDGSPIYQDSNLYAVYYSLFSLMDIDDLNTNLMWMVDVRDGKDSYFKKEGKEVWFEVFHKQIRQTDFFTDLYSKKRTIILTDSERNELIYLRSVVHKEGYKKDAPKKSGKLFTDEYSRYLELYQKESAEGRDKNIGGHIDSILWHMIHVDKKGILSGILKELQL